MEYTPQVLHQIFLCSERRTFYIDCGLQLI